jgi:hypothetical protein
VPDRAACSTVALCGKEIRRHAGPARGAVQLASEPLAVRVRADARQGLLPTRMRVGGGGGGGSVYFPWNRTFEIGFDIA